MILKRSSSFLAPGFPLATKKADARINLLQSCAKNSDYDLWMLAQFFIIACISIIEHFLFLRVN